MNCDLYVPFLRFFYGIIFFMTLVRRLFLPLAQGNFGRPFSLNHLDNIFLRNLNFFETPGLPFPATLFLKITQCGMAELGPAMLATPASARDVQIAREIFVILIVCLVIFWNADRLQFSLDVIFSQSIIGDVETSELLSIYGRVCDQRCKFSEKWRHSCTICLP